MARRHRHSLIGLLIALLLVLLGYGQQQAWFTPAGQQLQQRQPGQYQVSRFVDGDTIEINMNGQTEKIRMIGVDTPETHKPNTPVQCYGPAAAAYTKRLIGRQPVRLEADALSSNRDRYSRLLRYVLLPDGSNVNEQLVRNGYGFYYPYFSFTRAKQFAAAQAAAQREHKGLWGNCSPQPTDGGGYLSNPAVLMLGS